MVLAVGRGIAVGPILDGGPRHARERGGLVVFVPHFHNGKCHWVADVEMFPIHICQILTFPFGKRVVGKLDSWAFWRYIQFEDQSWGL